MSSSLPPFHHATKSGQSTTFSSEANFSDSSINANQHSALQQRYFMRVSRALLRWSLPKGCPVLTVHSLCLIPLHPYMRA